MMYTGFYEIRINDPDSFLGLRFPEYWVFRGQERDWSLKTTIERLFDELKYNYFWLSNPEWKIEESFDELFREKVALLLGNHIQGRLELRALMQHYGMPTRFLDFTKSFFIALYFAGKDCDSTYNDGVVWAVNLVELYKSHVLGGRVLNVNTVNLGEIAADYRSRNITEIGRCFPMLIPLDLYPEQLTKNKRFINQQGKFLMFMGNNGFEESFYSSFGLKKNDKQERELNNLDKNFIETKLIKFIVPQRIKTNLLQYLNNIKINQEFLFPDNDHLADKLENVCKEIIVEFKKQELAGRNY